jgi:hypothetical protein
VTTLSESIMRLKTFVYLVQAASINMVVVCEDPRRDGKSGWKGRSVKGTPDVSYEKNLENGSRVWNRDRGIGGDSGMGLRLYFNFPCPLKKLSVSLLVSVVW